MVIFTKKFGTLDPHLPVVWDKIPKKTFFFTPSLSIVLNFAFCCEHYYGQNSVRKLLKKLNKAFCFQRDPRMFWMCVCCCLVCSLRFSFLHQRHGGQIQTQETSKAAATCIHLQRHRHSQWRPERAISLDLADLIERAVTPLETSDLVLNWAQEIETELHSPDDNDYLPRQLKLECEQWKESFQETGWQKVLESATGGSLIAKDLIDREDPKHTLFCRETVFVTIYAPFQGWYSHPLMAIQVYLPHLTNRMVINIAK